MARGGIKDRLFSSIREIVFGLEDSFVSTLGTVSGVAVGSGNKEIVLLAGFVIVAVEALSMAAGSYLSSKAADELYTERMRQDAARVLSERVSDKESLREFFHRKGFSADEVAIAVRAIGRERKLWLDELMRGEFKMSPAASGSPLLAGVVMGVFYLVGGALVLVPYLLFPLSLALPIAVVMTCIALFILGAWKATLASVPPVRSGLEMMMVSLGAALLGMGIGQVFSFVTGISSYGL
ncbi:VIT1/CCC1 transporter family protein [Patescibacteria group bacterium]|jgi:VIT1/CCC1 family predicted Fe2+/Mn2+ transporter|nr:VIT1/CCC1 transporter family protein [Patescibacteria group bacterium]